MDHLVGRQLVEARPPDRRLVDATYRATNGTNDVLHRVAAIHADSSGLAGDALGEYEYLGVGRIVEDDTWYLTLP